MNTIKSFDQSKSIKSMHEAISFLSKKSPYLMEYETDSKNNVIYYPIKRLFRLNELNTVDVAIKYGTALSRIGGVNTH